MGRRAIDRFAILAVILGLSKLFGSFTGVWFLSALGDTVAIAPAPSAFSRVVSLEGYQSDRAPAFECETKGRQSILHMWDYNFRAAIPGPHRRTAMFVNYFILAATYNRDPLSQTQFQHLNQYYLCQGGALSQAAKCEPPVDGVRFRWNNFGSSPPSFSFTEEKCSP